MAVVEIFYDVHLIELLLLNKIEGNKLLPYVQSSMTEYVEYVVC
jgi:hypothetical protein